MLEKCNQVTPNINPGWGINRSRAACQDRFGDAGGCEAGHDSAMGTQSPESQTCPVLHPKQCYEGNDSPPLLHW